MTEQAPQTVRLAHVSDIHITAPHCRWQWRDWASKRVTGWMNLHWGGRAKRFCDADKVMAALMADLRQQRPDHIVFSGDATALGFVEEVRQAAAAFTISDHSLPPGLAVPGNHDYYLSRAARSGEFERSFAAWQEGERVDGSVYPFAQRVGPLWLVAVNSATPHAWPTNASGLVGAEQRDRLRRLLERLAPGPRVLVTHYPLAQFNGRPQRTTHGLRDLAEFVQVVDQGGIALWLHGHDHRSYWLDDRRIAPFPMICVGSSTECEKWGYNTYAITGLSLEAVRRTYHAATASFQAGDSFQLQLRD